MDGFSTSFCQHTEAQNPQYHCKGWQQSWPVTQLPVQALWPLGAFLGRDDHHSTAAAENGQVQPPRRAEESCGDRACGFQVKFINKKAFQGPELISLFLRVRSAKATHQNLPGGPAWGSQQECEWPCLPCLKVTENPPVHGCLAAET